MGSTIPIELREFLLDRIIPHLPTSAVKVGDKYNMRCPFCGDSQKSSTKKRGYLYLQNASYHCFNCDINLSGFKFASSLEGIDEDELKKEYVRFKYGEKGMKSVQVSCFSTSTAKKNPIADLPQVVKKDWKRPLTDLAKSYLDKRMVTSAPFLKEPLYSYIAKDGGEYILIPWIINGVECYYQINDFQRLNKAGLKYIFPKNTKKMIYGLDNVDTSFPYIFAFEGVYDSMFVKNGICLGGKSMTELQAEIISKRFPRHEVVMCLDNDRPGLIASGRSVMKNMGLKYFKWFDDTTPEKDINDYVLAHKDPKAFSDPEKLKGMVVNSIMMKMFLVGKGLWDVKESNGQGQKRQRQVLECEDWGLSALAP